MQRLNVLQDRDRGAVAVVFAISLIMLIGFVGLAVDVGSAYAKTQEVQNAADAGALAVAQECAEADPACAPGEQEPLAGDLAEGNIRHGYDPLNLPDVKFPKENRVTVTVTAENENFFAALFGFDTFTITREATAQWDSPTEGPTSLPLTISACSFFEQAKDDPSGEPLIPQTLDLWLPMPSGSFKNGDCNWHDTYPGGGFGWLDFDPDTCTSDVIVGDPPAAGSDPGNNVPGCVKDVVAEAITSGEVLLIPIFKSANGLNGNNAKYEIMRFAAMEILGMEFHTGSPKFIGEEECGEKPPGPLPDEDKNFYSNTCIRGRFVDWVELGEDYTGGAPKTEVSIIRLIDPDYEDSHSA